MIYSLLLLFLTLLFVSFVIGNISLMKNGNNRMTQTQGDIRSLLKDYSSSDLGMAEELKKYGQKLTKEAEKECKAVQDHIAHQYRFKKGEQTQVEARDEQSLLQGSSKQLAPIDSLIPKAPVLEKFEDYAPVDLTGPPSRDTGIMHPKENKDPVPRASNEFEPQQSATFESEFRVPWNEKAGKDELSQFFNVHAFDKNFDQILRKPVACPTEWEQKYDMMKYEPVK
jgi:hypothetical protein